MARLMVAANLTGPDRPRERTAAWATGKSRAPKELPNSATTEQRVRGVSFA
jgi:hypothetical protein